MQILEPSPSLNHVESHQSSNGRSVKFCPRLPLELWDKTIDETLSESDPWDHRQHVLRQLSLVCRAWLPRSRYWLFKRIELASHDYVIRFEQLLAESPGIARNVQQLSMCIMYPFRLQSQEEPRSWTGVIQDITRRLPNMIAFELSPGHIVHLSPLRHSNIRELRLRHAKFHSLKSLRSCLQSMPNLEQLELSMAEYGGAEDGTDDKKDGLQSDKSTASGLSIVPRLTCLKVTAASPSLAIEVIYMLTQKPAPPIRELELGHLPDQCLRTNLDWFRNIAPNVEHLRVALSADSDHHGIESFFSFHHCRRLRSLALRVNRQKPQHAFSLECLLLSQITSNNMEKLHLDIFLCGPIDRPSGAPHWQAFVDVLKSSKFARLEKLHLGFHMVIYRPGLVRSMLGHISSEFLDEVRSAFPEFVSKGILYVTRTRR